MRELTERPWFRSWPVDVPRHINYPKMPLSNFLTDSALSTPDKIAFSCNNQNITYNELEKATDRVACYLKNSGLRCGDRIVLFLPNSIEYVIGYYSILKAGCTIIPSNPLYKENELLHIFSDSKAKGIITSAELYPVIESIRNKTGLKTVIAAGSFPLKGVQMMKDIIKPEAPADRILENFDPSEHVAAIQYTGGTTGLPKGAMLTHFNLVANAMQSAAWFNWTKDELFIGLLPFYHSWGACTCVNTPIYIGARVIILPRFSAKELLETIQREKATVLFGAASMFTTLMHDPILTEYDITSLKYVKAGAMIIPPEIARRWEDLTGVKMLLGYGLSEASPETHNSPVDKVKPGTIGIPISDTDAKIVDQETGKIKLPPGEVGELIIQGPQVMKGYLNREEDNEEALRNGWLYTGDLATVDEDGYFRIVDRKKDIIKYKGYTIAPGELEAILYQHPAVRECAVIGKPDPSAGEIPCAYVVVKPGHSSTADELIDFCEQRVSAYKKIRYVVFTDEIPKTNVGKILRRLLRDKQGSSEQ